MKHKTYDEYSKIPVKLEMFTELHVKRKEGTYVFRRVATVFFSRITEVDHTLQYTQRTWL